MAFALACGLGICLDMCRGMWPCHVPWHGLPTIFSLFLFLRFSFLRSVFLALLRCFSSSDVKNDLCIHLLPHGHTKYDLVITNAFEGSQMFRCGYLLPQIVSETKMSETRRGTLLCADMCVDVCVDKFVDMCVEMCVDVLDQGGAHATGVNHCLPLSLPRSFLEIDHF